MATGSDDPKGEHGGDTGKTDQRGQGAKTEKGDQRRDKPTSEGQTRDGKAGGTSGKGGHRSGSQSNAGE